MLLNGRMKKHSPISRWILPFIFLFQAQAWSQELNVDSIHPVVEKSLRFLTESQFKEDNTFYKKGEFPVVMKTYLIPSLVGLGKSFSRPTEEPTAFVTSTIINLVSEAYLLDSRFKAAANSIIDLGLPSINEYRIDDLFFYYPQVEFKGLKIHAPKDPAYVPRRMLSLALVPPDADTTSVSYTALAYVNLVKNQTPLSEFRVPEKTLQAWSDFRDLNRDPHPYNRVYGVKRTGAFLTWLWDEKASSSSFWKSMSDKPDKGYRIVFGRNDVDCVVNANVLRLLSLSNNQDHAGYADTCNYLNRTIQKVQAKSCGIYYPSTLNPIYAISNAYKSGATCLSQSRAEAIRFIINGQNLDGSWSNDEGQGRPDHVQSTAWAIGALLNYIDVEDRSVEHYVRLGVRYLLSQAKTKGKDQIFWPGEIFFSGSAAARNTILWRSDSYTTAVVLLSLKKAELYLKREVPK